jgi:hypothetical protein
LRAAQALSGENLAGKLARRVAAFDQRFEALFGLADKACTQVASGKGVACSKEGRLTPAAVETGKVALSQVL